MNSIKQQARLIPTPSSTLDQGNLIQRFLSCDTSKKLPARDAGEITRSRSTPMTVETIISGGSGLMLSNFTVNGDQIKGDTTTRHGEL